MKIKDLGMRALKTFGQAFFAVLIPQVVLLLNSATEVDWSNWSTYMPVICAALAAGLSAIQNALINASSSNTTTEEK